MKQLVENIINGNATEATSLVEKALNQKLTSALKEQRKLVAEQVYDLTEFRYHKASFHPKAQSPEEIQALIHQYEGRIEKESSPKEKAHYTDVVKHLKGRLQRSKKSFDPNADRKKSIKNRGKEAATNKAGQVQHLHALMQMDKQAISRIKGEISKAKQAGHSTETLKKELASREHAFQKRTNKMTVLTKANNGRLPEGVQFDHTGVHDTDSGATLAEAPPNDVAAKGPKKVLTPAEKAARAKKWNERMPWPKDYSKSGLGSRSSISGFSEDELTDQQEGFGFYVNGKRFPNRTSAQKHADKHGHDVARTHSASVELAKKKAAVKEATFAGKPFTREGEGHGPVDMHKDVATLHTLANGLHDLLMADSLKSSGRTYDTMPHLQQQYPVKDQYLETMKHIGENNFKVSLKDKQKWILMDIGGSGAYMVDKADGSVYRIKSAYGVPNLKKFVGNINTVTADKLFQYRWW
jgi:hypothetical protein